MGPRLAGLALVGIGWAGPGAPSEAQAARKPAACNVSVAFPPGCATQGPAGTPFLPGVNCRAVEVDGFPRQYAVYVPQAPRPAWPVVFMHHGSSGNGYQFLGISGWREKADEVGLVAVFPTALEGFVLDEQRCSTKWHAYGQEQELDLQVRPRLVSSAGAPLRDYPAQAPWPADDVAFERAMLADLRAGLPLDPARLYVSGFSNGASFAARLAIEMSDEFVAAAWSGGGLPDPAVAGLPPVAARHIPAAMEFGECDDRVMENFAADFDPEACARGAGGGLPLAPAALLGLPAVAARIEAHLDALALRPSPRQAAAAADSACLAWRTPAQGNADGNSYRFSVLARVTHQYASCNQERCNNPRGFSAADRFWAFFEGRRGCD